MAMCLRLPESQPRCHRQPRCNEVFNSSFCGGMVVDDRMRPVEVPPVLSWCLAEHMLVGLRCSSAAVVGAATLFAEKRSTACPAWRAATLLASKPGSSGSVAATLRLAL